jgi:hypothetical protein
MITKTSTAAAALAILSGCQQQSKAERVKCWPNTAFHEIVIIVVVAVGTAFAANQIMHNKSVYLTPEQSNQLAVAQERLNAVILAGGSETQLEAAKADLSTTEQALALVALSPAFAKK